MRFALAILLPPVAVLSCGRILQTFLNILLWILGIVPGVIHACLIVNQYYQDRRTRQVIEEIRATGRRPVLQT